MFLSTVKVLLIPFTNRSAHAQAPCSHNGLYVNRNAASVRTVLWHCVDVGGAYAGLWPGVNEGGAGRTRKVPGSVPDTQTRMYLLGKIQFSAHQKKVVL